MKQQIVKMRVPLTRQNLSTNIHFIKNKLLNSNENFIVAQVILEIDKKDKQILFAKTHINLQNNYDVDFLHSIIRDNFEHITLTKNSEAITAKRIIFEYAKITEDNYNKLNDEMTKKFIEGKTVNPPQLS